MNALKNYFFIFAIAYGFILATKFLFLGFYYGQYRLFDTGTLLYALLWGYRFDFALAAVAALLATRPDFNARALRFTAAVVLAGIVLLQLADILYYEDASRHIGYELTDIFNDFGGLFMTALSQNTLFTVTALLGFPLLVTALQRQFRRLLHPVAFNRYYFPKKLLLIGLSVFFIRGMFVSIPLNPWQSSQIGDNRLAMLALNGGYNAVFSLFTANGNISLPALPPVKPGDIGPAFSTLYDDNGIPYTRHPHRRNVVLFFLESWSAGALKPYGSPVQTTPFFDSILPRSLHPKAAIANGHRTTEGMFAALVSYPNPLGKTIAKTRLQDFRYRSLIDILNAHGYSSAFFQGTAKETSGTGALAQKLGFKESYGKEDVTGRRFGTNHWGIYDQDLYDFALKKLETMPVPFVIGINGATTHDDKLPDGIKRRHFSDNEKENNRLNALHFSDAALGAFVRAVEARYPDTLFVFFADHCGGAQQGNFRNYMIPLAFYGPHVRPAAPDIYASQRDIAPTVLDFVLGDYKKLAPDFTGKSLLRDRRFFADYFRNGVFGWIEKNLLTEYTPAAGKTACFDVSGLTQQPVPCPPEAQKYRIRMSAFASVTQKLLFEGKTGEFHRYRYRSR